VDRPYREHWPKEKIKEYLEENAGKKFDPVMVEAFLRIVRKSRWSLLAPQSRFYRPAVTAATDPVSSLPPAPEVFR
jgi:HD-GYP domain-containing protein (c-di-GMP phosphodiesterase class II)